ncbi:choice-of-anchor D domain-containing protein, partial [Pontibacter diazotrophicus]
ARHENAFVQAGDKFYLLGGRGVKPVQVYDPATKTWANKASTPTELHHFQAVTIDGLIYVAGAFTGGYPYEKPVPKVYIYNPVTDKWLDGPTIPETRRRGSAGVVVHNKKIYLVSGITDGHSSGHVAWFDEYDPLTNTWKTLPDAPRARDHYHAAVINNKLYLAGGRRSSDATGETFKLTVPEVDVFDFETNKWETLPGSSNIPTQRAGAATAVLGDELLVIGGESGSQSTAHVETEAFNVRTNSWRRLADLVRGRHGTQAITSNNGIYIVAGSGSRGGSPELSTQEAFYMYAPSSPDGVALTQSRLNTPSTVSFGTVDVNASSSKTVTISNSEGNQDIVITSITISGGSSFSYNAPYALPFVLPVGKSLNITVTYQPTTSEAQGAEMVINHSGQNGSSVIALSGGTNAVSASPNSLHFFSQQAGTTSEAQDVTLTNNTTTTLEMSSVSITGTNNSEFTHNFTQSLILAAGASTSISVKFTPASAGTKVAKMSITHSGSTTPLAVELSGEGHNNTGGTGTAVYRINSGGGEVTNSIGTFSADNYFSPVPGYTYSTTSSISGTSDDAMYQSERSATTNNGTFSYAFPVSSGQYKVVLHFAEIYWTSVGQRVFDVSLEGVKVLDNFDIMQKVGAKTATTETFTVDVADGTLDMFFSATTSDGGVNRPKVSAIEVLGVVSGENQAPVADAGDDQAVTAASDGFASVQLDGSGSTDADGTVASYVWTEGGAQLATGATPTVSLGVGTHTLTLTVTDDEGATDTDQVTVTVNSGVGELVYNPSSLHFFSQEAGTTSQPQAVTLANSGTTSLEVSTVSITGTNSTEFAHSFTSPITLAAGSSTSLDVTFSPASLGTKVAQLNITHTGTNSPVSVGLTGEGIDDTGTTELYRVNSGGGEVTNSIGTFSADNYFSPVPGYTYSTTSSISGTSDDAMYQSERSATTNNGTFSYAFPVSSGQYKVVLHFAEIYWTSVGQRVFDVSLEGVKVLDNFDIMQKVGAKTATTETFTVDVADGTLDMFFSATTSDGGVNRPKVSAIEVLGVVSGENQAPVADAGDDQAVTAASDGFASVQLDGSGSTDAEGTVASYVWTEGGAQLATGATPTVSLGVGTHTLTLTVTDDEGATDTDQVTVTVNPTQNTGQKVGSFTLVDARTYKDLYTLTDGSRINLASLPNRSINIRANTSPSIVGSVVFNLTGTETSSTKDNKAPYAFKGDAKGKYHKWTPSIGTYTLSATPFTSSGGGGNAGTGLTVAFTVVDQVVTSQTLLRTAVESEAQGHSISVYPNPSQGYLLHLKIIGFSETERVLITLYDLTGKAIQYERYETDESGNIDEELVLNQHINKGVYIIKAQSASGEATTRLVVL